MDMTANERDGLGRELLRRIRETIPIAAQMGMRGLAFDGETLRLSFPLAPNTNDKGTAFAGSSYSLMVLSSWALVTLILEQAGERASVVVASATVDYSRPLTEAEPVAVAQLAKGDTSAELVRRFRATGKVKASVVTRICTAEGVEAAAFHGLFVARR